MKGTYRTREEAKEAVLLRVKKNLTGGRTIYEFDDGSYGIALNPGHHFSYRGADGAYTSYGKHEYWHILTYVSGVGWCSPTED